MSQIRYRLFINDTEYTSAKIYGTDYSKIYVGDTLYWEKNQNFVVKFVDYDGNLLKYEIVQKNQSATPPTNPVRQYYTFIGWNKSYDNITHDTIITALYERILCKITFTTIISQQEIQTIYKYIYAGNSFIELPYGPAIEDKNFIGWYDSQEGGNKITTATIFTGNMTVYSQYESITFILTFNGNGGTPESQTKTITIHQPIGNFPTVTKEGYIVENWLDAKNTPVYTTTVPTQNSTYYAKWAKYYTITFNSVGGTSTESTRYVVKDSAIGTLPIATKTSSLFVGWFTAETGGTQITEDTVPTEDATYYAQWSKYHTITFNPVGGICEESVRLVAENEKIGTLPNAVKSVIDTVTLNRYSLKFVGWFTAETGGTQITEDTVPTEDATYYAQWIGYNIITFDSDGGSPETQIRNVIINSAIGTLPTATKDNYMLYGWYTADGDRVYETTKPFNDETYIAKWKKTYTLTFDPNGGKVEEETRIVVEGVAIGGLPTPTRSKYTFLGWYKSKQSTEESDKITSNTTIDQNTTVFAQWLN